MLDEVDAFRKLMLVVLVVVVVVLVLVGSQPTAWTLP